MSDDDASVDEAAERIRDELAATEEVPVERAASRWIGEAQAVAADVATGDLDESVARRRVARLGDLLRNVEGTGSERADERVEAARRIVRAVGAEEE